MKSESEFVRITRSDGKKSVEKFNENHAAEARCEYFKSLRRADALELVNKWNRVGEDYKYFLNS